jgi:hypothetical protein
MIAKHIPMHAVNKSGFARLVRYLTDTQGKQERTGEIRLTNCISDDVEMASLEVLNTQALNKRSLADKTYHLVVSFRDGEEPDAASLVAIEERICDGLGFVGHQRISVEHRDTDNRHLHIAINKIHPTRYTIHEPYLAYKTLARVCETLEVELALRKDNHVPRKVDAENRAADMEHHAGVESLLGWVQRRCKQQMQHAQSWGDLHAVMSSNGLHLHRRANGLVITAQDGTTMKASSVGREFSKPKLEERFGPFQAAPEQDVGLQAECRYERKSLYVPQDASELYGRYQGEQTRLASIRTAKRKRIRQRKERQIEAIMRSVRLKRAALKLVVMPRVAKKMMYEALANAMRDEIAEIKRKSAQECKVVDQACRQHHWIDWLRQQAGAGEPDALAVLRRSKPTCDLVRGGVSGTANTHAPFPTHRCDSVTRQGTIIFRVGPNTIRDEGDALHVSIGADQVAVQATLRMAVERFGNRITVKGSEAFKKQIVIAAATEKLRVVFVGSTLDQHRMELTDLDSGQGSPLNDGETSQLINHHIRKSTTINARNVGSLNQANSIKLKRQGSNRGRR